MDYSRIQAMRDNRVYISGPVTGIDDYMERFCNAEKELKEQGLSVVNPAKVLSQMPADTTSYEEYMQMSMMMLSMCSHIYMLKAGRSLQELTESTDMLLQLIYRL